MTFPAIAEIKKRRQNLDLSQKQLASLCDIGQSFLAKIERGQAMPSYLVATKVFEKLLDLESKKSEKLVGAAEDKRAKDVMTDYIYSFVPTDSAEQILKVMIEKNISQVPIVDKEGGRGGILMGIITEKTLMGKEVIGKSAKDIMDSKNLFPIIARDTKLSVILSILQEEQAVLVADKGKFIGIITKQDILKRRR